MSHTLEALPRGARDRTRRTSIRSRSSRSSSTPSGSPGAPGLEVREELVGGLEKVNGRFEATLDERRPHPRRRRRGRPGHPPLRQAFPDWAASVPPERSAHTCDLVEFERARGRARPDRRWPPERVRVGRPAPRARRGADRHRPPPRRPALRARELALRRRRTSSAPSARPGLLAQPPDERAGGDRAAVLGGRAADARGLADAATGLGPHPPAPRRPRRRPPTRTPTTRCT